MFQCPRERAAALEEVKRAVGVHHSHLDGWIYLFLANKKFDVGETIAKLRRRDDMERTVFSDYTMTDNLRKSMRAGVVQYIGRDKEGRPVLYFNTARDFPKVEQRAERQSNLDMFLSWSVRCDPKNPTAMVTWLINQKDASMLRNTDLIFQKDMALRISKFFPGVVGRMFICNMSTALTFVMKPLLRQLPSAISDCIFLFSAGDIKRGELLSRIDASVLPVEMGGLNDCDHPPNYERFASGVEDYFARCITALHAGITIKDMEVMEMYGVDRDGKSVKAAAAASAGAAESLRSTFAKVASEETLDLATMHDPCAVTVDAATQRVTVQSAVRAGRGGAGPEPPTNQGDLRDWNMSFAAPPAIQHSAVHHVPSDDFFDCISEPAGSVDELVEGILTKEGLYRVHVDDVQEFSFSAVLSKVSHSSQSGPAFEEQRDACLRDWISFRCQCVDLVPKLERLLAALRGGAVLSNAGDELATRLRRCSHFMLNLFPQTRHTVPFPLLDWYATGATAAHRRGGGSARPTEVDIFSVNPRRLAFRLDCTSPDNALLSAQAGAMEFVEDWDDFIAVAQRRVRVVRRLLLTWPLHTGRDVFEAGLRARARQLWAQLAPLFRSYIEAKVGMSIAEFVRHYGLLASGGKIKESSEWYRQLFAAVLQYRELHRRNYLFYIFPPQGHGEAAHSAEPPSMEDLLRAHGDPEADVAAAIYLTTLIEQSVRYTADQLEGGGAAGSSGVMVATRTVVERYLEVSKAKIYIPYDMQRTGVSPEESAEHYKRTAAACLRDAEAPLQEFLFTTVSLAVLQREYPAEMTEAEVKARLQAAKAESTQEALDRQEHQRVAMAFARVCADLQGSFGSDTYSMLTTYPAAATQADGYALGLELLMAVAMLKSRRGSGGGASPTSADLVPPVPHSSEDDAAAAEERDALQSSASLPTPDLESLLETLNAMHHPASRLAALKRQFIY